MNGVLLNVDVENSTRQKLSMKWGWGPMGGYKSCVVLAQTGSYREPVAARRAKTNKKRGVIDDVFTGKFIPEIAKSVTHILSKKEA
jgi:hypothetical protein